MSVVEMVLHDASALVPLIVEEFGDTPLLQARRLDALEAEIVHQSRQVRQRNKAAFLARQAVAA